MTAVEWFMDKLDDELELYNSQWLIMEQYFDQAKEMEKQQKGYSEEEVDRILRNFRTDFLPIGQVNDLVFNEWFEQFKKK